MIDIKVPTVGESINEVTLVKWLKKDGDYVERDEVIAELGRGNRLEFRDFGVFESKQRAARVAQNPKTMERVPVPSKRTVKFKVGRMMKIRLQEIAKAQAARDGQAASATATAQPAAAKA